MKIYVASSWRNEYQPAVVAALRTDEHEVYDFRNPAPGNRGFAWSQIDPAWESWSTLEYIEALDHPIAAQGFELDMAALQRCEGCVLVLPSGRSAHIEAGYAVGSGMPTWVYSPTKQEPELMYLMTHGIYENLDKLVDEIRLGWEPEREHRKKSATR